MNHLFQYYLSYKINGVPDSCVVTATTYSSAREQVRSTFFDKEVTDFNQVAKPKIFTKRTKPAKQ